MISPRFIQLLEEMRTMHEKKNAAYAGGDPDPFRAFRISEEFFNIPAFTGCMLRIGDKFNRITNLVKDPSSEKVGESIKDTLLDMAVYCLLAICLYEQQEEKENVRSVSKQKTHI